VGDDHGSVRRVGGEDGLHDKAELVAEEAQRRVELGALDDHLRGVDRARHRH